MFSYSQPVEIRREIVYAYQEQSDKLGITFICSDGQQKCDPWILGFSRFFTHKLEASERFGNKLEFKYDMYSKACIKIFLDVLHGLPMENVPRETLLELLNFLKFEGKSDNSSFEKQMFHGLHEKLLDAELDLETKILVALVCDRFDNYSGEFKEKLKRDHDEDDITRATRQVDLRSEQNKPLVEMIAKQKIDSKNIDTVEEEIEFQVFKFDRSLRSSSRMSTEVPQQSSKKMKNRKAFAQRKNASGPIQIFINTGMSSGPKTLVLDLREDMTVSMVKNVIEERTGVPMDTQRLVYGGKPLSNANANLQRDYNVQNNSTLMMLINTFSSDPFSL